MIRRVAKWFSCGLLLSVLGAMAGCGGTGQLLPNDGGAGSPDYEGRPAWNGDRDPRTVTHWFESWETAALGPKGNGEVFEADAGSWKVWLYTPENVVAANGSWIGNGASILEEGRFLLLSHATYLGWGQTGTFARLQQDMSLVGGFLGAPVTADTVFSGVLECNCHASPAPNYYAAGASVHIEIGIGPFSLRYVHQSSKYLGFELGVDPPPFDTLIDTIIIEDHFERNLCNDLVTFANSLDPILGPPADVSEYCPGEACRITYIVVETRADMCPDSQSTSGPPDDPGRYAECSCEIPWLAIGE